MQVKDEGITVLDLQLRFCGAGCGVNIATAREYVLEHIALRKPRVIILDKEPDETADGLKLAWLRHLARVQEWR